MHASLLMLKAAPAAMILLAATSAAHVADGGDAVKGPPRSAGAPRLVMPQSSLKQPNDIGRRSHTNYGIVVPPPITGPAPQHSPRPGDL